MLAIERREKERKLCKHRLSLTLQLLFYALKQFSDFYPNSYQIRAAEALFLTIIL